jgi:type II secretory ATPase GspE/PulE/Tfp pilus assembly ATPase PilB-like protein
VHGTIVDMYQFDDSRADARIRDLHTHEEERLLEIIAKRYGLPYINLRDRTIHHEILALIPEEKARAGEMVSFAEEMGEVYVALRNPKNPILETTLDILRAHGKKIKLYLTTQGSLEHAWEHYADISHVVAHKQGVLDIDPELIKTFTETIHSHLDVGKNIVDILKNRNPRHISMILSVLFGGALSLNASDIHIEPEATTARVRYRLDGVLWDICTLESHTTKQIVSRIKLLAGTKLNIRKEAQDGRFTFDIGTRTVEVRTSVIPGAYGESLVMRLLDPHAENFKIENLGMNSRMYDIMQEELRRPHGAIITTGPTGSGKTTALYSFLVSIHKPDIKIITLEDPVEYKLQGIVQTQITPEYTFSRGLRTILRQDPDVILVGEIRDHDVAETAIHAALTGHLVFSTLHTNSAVGSIARLVDMGIDPRLIASACNIFIGQRLIRKICDACKIEREMTVEEQKLISRILEQPIDIHTLFEGRGCDQCGNSGYKGRLGVFEAIQIDTSVKEMLALYRHESQIKEATKHQNIPSMQQDGVMKVLAGITTLDEISRVLDLHHID